MTRQIILAGAHGTAADAFAAFYQLEELRRVRDHTFRSIDALALPTAPTIYTIDEVLADPIGLNSRLGTYTNFVNLLDLCGLAVPASMRPDGTPFGVTLLAPAGEDAALAAIGREFHHATGLPLGALKHPQPAPARRSSAPAPAKSRSPSSARISPACRSMANCARPAARLIARAKTAPHYRLYALAGTRPPKPGLLRVKNGAGTAIEVEVWALSESAFGRFVAAVPPPLVDRHARTRRRPRGQGLFGRGRGGRRRARYFELRRLARVHGAGEGAGLSEPSIQLGSSIKLTCAATTRQPSAKRTQVCICRPTFPGTLARWNSVEATAWSRP